MALKEFGDALQWARAYGMSTDPVRQAQWLDADVCEHSIDEYLAKVSSDRWVLDECCRRVPDDPETLELLLSFGVAKSRDAIRAAAAPATDAADAADAADALSEADARGYNRRLRRYVSRLRTGLALGAVGGVTADGDESGDGFDAEAHRAFRDAELLRVALGMAQRERFGAIGVMVDRCGADLARRLLLVLRAVPETTDPAEYEPLLRRAMAEAREPRPTAPEAGEEGEEEEEAAGGHDEDAGGEDAGCARLAAWFESRACEIDAVSGQLDVALALLEVGRAHGLGDALRSIHQTVSQLHALVYRLGCEVSLHEYAAMSADERLAMLLRHSPAAAAAEAAEASAAAVARGGSPCARASEAALLDECVAFFVAHLLPFVAEHHDASMLRELAVDLAADGRPYALVQCAALVALPAAPARGAGAEAGRRPLGDERAFIEVVLRCVYACPRRDEEALELMTAMYTSLPPRDEALANASANASATASDDDDDGGGGGGTTRVARLLDELDELERHLAAQHNLREYGLLQPMCAFRAAPDGSGLDAETAQRLLRAMARSVARRSPAASSSQWLSAREDMQQLRHQACRSLPAELPDCEWLQSLLLAGCFRLGADFLRSADADAIDAGVVEALVLAAAVRAKPPPLPRAVLPTPRNPRATPRVAQREYFNAAVDAADPALARAAECVRVLPDSASDAASEAVQLELQLVDALRLLSSLGSPLLPLQLRLHTDRTQLLLDTAAACDAAASRCAHAPDARAPRPRHAHTRTRRLFRLRADWPSSSGSPRASGSPMRARARGCTKWSPSAPSARATRPPRSGSPSGYSTPTTPTRGDSAKASPRAHSTMRTATTAPYRRGRSAQRRASGYSPTRSSTAHPPTLAA